jgi:O-antigen/teichoic acid export membrane protein
MRRQLSNSIYGLLDYAAYPIGMLVVAPLILRNLGAAQYGIWMVTASVVNIGSILASGFGDANTQRAASQRGTGHRGGVARVVRAAMGIHLALGLVSALAICCLASQLAVRLAPLDLQLQSTCLLCIRMAAGLTVILAIETVCVSTQKAFERYGAAVRISVGGRLVSLAAAAALAEQSRGVAAIMAVTAIAMTTALALQIIALRQLVGMPVRPSYEGSVSNDLLRFGIFTWILAAAGALFGQADRLVGGASLGAAGVVSYALCAQLSQPVYGLTAAGLHFLFPYITSRRADKDANALGRTLLVAVATNVGIVAIAAASLLAVSGRLLHLLAPEPLARAGMEVMPWVLAGSTLLALSVTGAYAMVALGRVSTVAALNAAACVALALIAAGSLRDRGVMAIAEGRIAFALIAMCVYIPLWREIRVLTPSIEQIAPTELVEGA